jgi:integrase
MPKIGQKPNGLYYAAVTLSGHRHWCYGRTKKEVSDKLVALQVESRQGVLAKPTNLTVADYLDGWLESIEPNVKESTFVDYHAIVRLHLKPAIGAVRLSRLSALDVSRMYAVKLKSNLSARRVQLIGTILHKALSDAVKLGVVSHNVCDRVDRPRVERTEPSLWTEEQLHAFVGNQANLPCTWGNLWLFLLATGCRVSEALALEWPSVNLANRYVTIKQSLMRVRNQPIVSTPKTRSSVRTLSLPDLAIQVLKAEKSRLAESRLRAGPGWPPSAFVYLTESGHHPSLRGLLTAFHQACHRAGVPAIRIHDLRHLSASLLVKAGADVKSVQKRMGHSSLQTTLGIYAHVLSKTDQALASQIDLALGVG